MLMFRKQIPVAFDETILPMEFREDFDIRDALLDAKMKIE